MNVPITVAHGDGIGPEIMEATLRVLSAAGARIAPEVIEIGERVYARGHSAGIEPSAWASLRRTRVFLKAPITTPQGGGYKSLNVTVRKTLGLYANVRPCTSYHPVVATPHPDVDVVIVRENEEDLYAGIEHRQTDEVVQCLKLVSRPGCEKIIRYAFEYARANGRKKVTCMSKDNIMKLTDGLFHRVFDEVKAEYPEIATNHLIIDIGAARLATRPKDFDVVVTLNLFRAPAGHARARQRSRRAMRILRARARVAARPRTVGDPRRWRPGRDRARGRRHRDPPHRATARCDRRVRKWHRRKSRLHRAPAPPALRRRVPGCAHPRVHPPQSDSESSSVERSVAVSSLFSQ